VPAALPAAYVNPVCGLRIDPREALHVLSWKGQQFYFCCDGCKLAFEREPARYAAIQAAAASSAAAGGPERAAQVAS
jgi:xanthine dehydrogenase accessory factor